MQDRSPRILYVTRVWPSENGAFLRSLNVLRALQEIGSVEVAALDDGAPSQDAASRTEFDVAHFLDVRPQPNKGFVDKLRWTLDPRRQYPNGWAISDEAISRVLPRLTSFDLIWFSTLHSPDMFPITVWPRSVLDIDDLPSTHSRSSLNIKHGLSERLLARRNTFAWRRRERLLGQRFTVLCVCSEEDRRYLTRIGVQTPVHVIPNAFERPVGEPVRNPVTPPRIGFIGFFNYFPNRDGIQWFLDQCWPQIRADVPDARLRLIGEGSDAIRTFAATNVDALGWLADPSDEIGTWSVMVVPIRMGAGTRVKIAQAFSLKCPVVSTTLGAHGYGAVNERDMLLADTATSISAACVRAIREPALAAEIAEKAWRRYLDNWTWEAVRPRVWAAAKDCLRLRVGA